MHESSVNFLGALADLASELAMLVFHQNAENETNGQRYGRDPIVDGENEESLKI
jgi:hypothetical protein